MVDVGGGSGAASGIATFTYDNLYRLRSEHDSAPQVLSNSYVYSSGDDPIGVGSVTQEVDAAHELCWAKAGASAGSCGSPPSGAAVYGYNSAGDRTGSAGTTLSYDNRGLMTAAGDATYVYGPDGLRVAKTVAGVSTSFVWDDAAAVPLLLVDGGGFYVYGPGGEPVARLGGAKADTRWLVHDTTGSVAIVTDNNANVTTVNTFSPWGATRTHSGEQITLGCKGQYTDPETGFIYLRARYYDPATAQFLTRDPLDPVTRSTYGYVYNNPLNAADPTGLGCLVGKNLNGSCRGASLLSGALGEWGELCDAMVSGVVDIYNFVRRNPGVVASAGAIAVCLSPLGFGICAAFSGLAFVARAGERIQKVGFRDSSGANITDGALTLVSLGLGARLRRHPWVWNRWRPSR